jgi:hypothetical protein
MRRYLVVANQTLLGERLLAEIRGRLAAGPCVFHLVVPATHARDHMVWTEGHDRVIAGARLTEALERFRTEGVAVDGEVGDASAMDAIRDVLHREPPFDEIILSTLPPGLSRWINQDLPHRIVRTFGVPLALVTAEPAAV